MDRDIQINVNFDIFGDLNNVENGADDRFVRTIINQYLCDLSNGHSHLPTTAHAMTAHPENPTPCLPQLRLLIGLLFVIILLDCVFANKNQIGLELECEFKNINDNFDMYNSDDLFNEYLQTTYAIAGSRPTSFKFNGSREQLDLKYFIGGFGHAHNFISVSANDIFYDNEYEHGVLLSMRLSNTPHTEAVILNEITDEMSEINILECKSGVYSCESGIVNKICNGIIIGMRYFYFLRFLLVFSMSW